jgi:hypothetical protein
MVKVNNLSYFIQVVLRILDILLIFLLPIELRLLLWASIAGTGGLLVAGCCA